MASPRCRFLVHNRYSVCVPRLYIHIHIFMLKGKDRYLVNVSTGAEALFADLGHFNKRAIQVKTFA